LNGHVQRCDREYISYSRIATFQACPLKFHFRYNLGLPQETIAASLVYGSSFHAALEHHFNELLAGNPAPGLDLLLDVFWDTWRLHEDKEIKFARTEGLNSMGHLADRMFRAFQASDLANPAGTIIGVEEEMIGELIPGIPELLARVDLLVDDGDSLVLTDFKTSRGAWSPDHVMDSAGQLLLYHELAKPLAEGRPIKLAFALFTKTAAAQVVLHQVPVDPHQVERTKTIVETVWRSIEAGNYYPNPSVMQCPSCPYREPCRAWRG
jgi:CRISPR/Cas system-associated exonuclease Cas4 (RecB family)